MKIENLIVKTVNTEKLIEFLAVQLNENEKLNIETLAVFETKFALDTDCCFCEIQNSHFDTEIQPVIDIECRIKKYNPDGSYSIRMDKADFVKTISLEDYFKMATEVKLIDFIRYNYNPRIIGNQNLLMKHIKASYAVPTA